MIDMTNCLKRLVAFVLVAVFCLCFTGCHKQGEIALSIEGTDFTSAFYSCALVFASNEARNRVNETIADSDNSSKIDYYAQSIDGIKFENWVKENALDTCRKLRAYELKCKENNIDMTEYFKDAAGQAESYWNSYGYGRIMPENGVSRATFNKYMEYRSYRQAYFDSIYGENGKNAIASDEVNKYITDNYVYINVLFEDAFDMDEEDVLEIKEKFNGYADRLRNGEKFAKINAEYNSAEYKDDNESTEIFDNDNAIVLGSDKTEFESEYYLYAQTMQVGEVKVFHLEKSEENDTPCVLLILKGDVLSKDNSYLKELDKETRDNMKGEEFDTNLSEFVASLSFTENKYATGQFKVRKIKNAN